MLKRIETMTLNELADAMRNLGVKTSNERLAAEIESGIYPFAFCVRVGDSSQRTYSIYKKRFDEWVDTVAVDIPACTEKFVFPIITEKETA